MSEEVAVFREELWTHHDDDDDGDDDDDDDVDDDVVRRRDADDECSPLSVESAEVRA